ncbi:MAG: putative diguanylate cyclase YcdT [Firmicutes bacterium ADurb.Bin300]|nr:MAG: putative diguanylate cyclase YcdT [Firmicutes bacterium ADurb.Bin300]
MSLKTFSQAELYYGFNKDTFFSQRSNIGESNLRVLKNLSVTVYFTEAAEVLFLRFFSPESLIRIVACLLTAALSLLVFFLCRKTLLSKKSLKSRSVNVLIFFTSLFYCLNAGFFGTFFSADRPGVKFIILLCVLQIIFIVPPFQSLLTFAFIPFFFIYFSIYLNEGNFSAINLFYTFVSISIGLVMSWSISKIKIENMISAEKLRKSNYDLYNENVTDSLTGLANRKMTLNTLYELFNNRNADAAYLNCICMEIDYFREYNRFYGTKSGDKVLILMCDALSNYCKKNGITVGRVGGGEFLILFNDSSPDKGEKAAKELQSLVRELNIPNEASPISSEVSVSLGLFTDKTDGYKFFEEIYTLSGRALYRAKENGGNKVWKYIPEINGFSPAEQ